MQLTEQQIKKFQKKIYDYYNTFGRTFSWRKTTNPYQIFISEVMLQQTQTVRVERPYQLFIKRFPDFKSVAKASLYEILEAWQGLGYNRRAKFLHQAANILLKLYKGKVPNDTKILETLPGIGKATAASIAAFAFNSPTVFVETNIRVVFIHLFLAHKENISDTELLFLSEQTLDRSAPRIWYYALTDYGAMLKSQGINPINKSKTYNKQSKFEGSDRQMRGAIIRHLLHHKTQNLKQICHLLEKSLTAKPERTKKIVDALVKEGFVEQKKEGKNSFYCLKS